MTKPFLNDSRHIEQLKHVEHQIASKQLQRAAQKLNTLVKVHPNDPRIYLLGAMLAQSTGNQQAALKSARRAHSLAPQWPVSSIYLAELLADAGQIPEALQLATDTIAHHATAATPDDVELLRKAAALAQRANAHTLAEQWLRLALQTVPDNPTLRHLLAHSLVATGNAHEGAAMLEDLLTQQPAHPVLRLNHLRACLAAGQRDKAQADAQALLALDANNHLAQFYFELASGKTPATQPAALITELFDEQAASYDALMVGQLHYRLPQDVAALIHQWYPNHDADILDLGCGTGLLGAALGPNKGVIVGVELSHKMVAQAIRRQVYDKFHTVNLLDALRETPAEQYHVIAALDVFIYVGDLHAVFADAQRILVPGGRLVFTCEQGTHTDADYALPDTYRYTHQRSYVQKLLKKAGFQNVALHDTQLHEAAGKTVPGFLVVAHKPEAIKTRTTRRRTPATAS